jgi:signal transduction histidine kinase
MLTRKVLRSSTFGLVALYMALMSASVLVLFAYIYWATAGYMARQTDLTIEAEIRSLAEHYQQWGLAGLTAVINERIEQAPAGAGVYLLTDRERAPLAGNLRGWPNTQHADGGWMSFRLRGEGFRGSGERSGEHLARARSFVLLGGLRLLVGRDVRELEAMRELILHALGWGLAITLALAAAGGIMMSATVVRRIEAINQVSREIMDGDLGRRIPTRGSDDDFDQLADNLNRMLDRITGLMQSVRQVSDSIAHDLRTPLTRLRSRLELARSREQGIPDEMHASIEQAIEEADALLATFNALLRIARIEAGSQRTRFAEVDLNGVLGDVAELYEPVAAERGHAFEVEMRGQVRVEGDRDLLFQALVNLVDNAIKYTPPGGRIRLTLQTHDDGAELAVADSGPGIPPELRSKVFERFFRLEPSRTTPGSGLGLSLVKAVADLHRAEIRLEDNRPGLRVILHFGQAPLQPSTPQH